MWELINNTVFPSDFGFIRDGVSGDELWVVVLKATFQITEGGNLKIAKEQVPVYDMPVYLGDEESSSIRYDTDILPEKSKVDFLIGNAFAYAPKDEEVTEIIAGFSVENILSKRLKVIGDRYWQSQLGLTFSSAPSPFERIALTYENAFGGIDENAPEEFNTFHNNPAGVGFAHKSKNLINRKLPNIEYINKPTRKQPNKNIVAGFGPIRSDWQPRRGYAGTFDEKWKKNRCPLFPTDFDPIHFFQCAPKDQQIEEIKGGERVELFNMKPDGNPFVFHLPKIIVWFESELHWRHISHNGNLQSIIVEPEENRLIITWHTHIRCQNIEQFLKYTEINASVELT